jgi:hypothetical protein
MRIQRLSWCEPFLAALRETGNATRACAIAGVKPHTAYCLKVNNTAFAEEWRAALAASPGKKNDTWMQKFLVALRETGVIWKAAEQAGVRRESVVRARHRNPQFDALCREALPKKPDWKPVYLAALRRTGRQDIAAQIAHVKKYKARDTRKLDSAFDAECRAALEANARERAEADARAKEDWKKAFLQELGTSCNVRAACDAARVSINVAYRERSRDHKFAEGWDDAIGISVDGLQGAAWQRAKEYSDSLMMMLLRAHRPELYRDGYNPLRFTDKQLDAMNDEERAALEVLCNGRARWEV